MTKLKLIAVAATREQWRWAAGHLYALLILTPLVLGTTYVALGSLVTDHPEVNFSHAQSTGCAVLAFVALAALSLSRASVEIYHVQRAESLFDTLPVSVDTHFYAALLGRMGRATLVAVAALLGRKILGGSIAWVELLLSVPLFIILLALTETLAAIEWIHWEHRKRIGVALVASVALPVCALMGGLLLLMIVKPDRLPHWTSGGLNRFGVLAVGIVVAASIFFFVRQAHRNWRAADMEYARRLHAGARRSFFGARVLGRLGSAAVAAQLARDLQLTARAFSSAVYVIAGLSVLWIVTLAAVLTTGVLPVAQADTVRADWFAATWLPAVMAIKVACVFVTATLGALLPVLVAYQIPHLWLERAVGATGAQVWQSKLWYTRVVSAPAPLLVWTVGVLTGDAPLTYALPLLIECVWLWWLVSTLMGLFGFEMPEQPGLAIILMEVLGLALGFGTALMWPAGLMLYLGMRELSLRGQSRAAYRLLKEAD